LRNSGISQGYPVPSSMFAPRLFRPVRRANQGLRTDFRRGSPGDQLIKQLWKPSALSLSNRAVMQRNANGRLNPETMQLARGVVARYVVLSILLPERGRPFRSKEFQHQRADFRGRLRAAPRRATYNPLAPSSLPRFVGANKEGFAGGINDLFVFGVSELRAASHGKRTPEEQTGT